MNISEPIERELTGYKVYGIRESIDNLSVAYDGIREGGMELRVVKDPGERREEILDAAWQLFAEKGFDNASTNDIIKRIGIARGTLYHYFNSKEEILDALVERMTREGIGRAKRILSDQSLPLEERLTRAILALDIGTGGGAREVFEQIHKPQNALLHQKMQQRLLDGVVPLIGGLIQEGNETGLFHSPYPLEAAEMILLYANIAFDELAGLTLEEKERKSTAFICHTERILGAKEKSLEEAIRRIFRK